MSWAHGLVGRDAEFSLATTAVRQLSEDRASALVIEGPAGIGKTRLVQSVMDYARSQGVAVFRGQAHPFERNRPFGVMASSLGLDRRSSDPPRAAIAALLAGEGASPSAAFADIQYRVVEQILDFVETACVQRPAVLVAEDIHWADSSSLLAILTLIRQLALAPLLVVVTARPSPLPVETIQLLDDMLALGARSLRLAALAPNDVVGLARQELGAPPGPRLTAMLDKAGGHPLWVVSILKSLSGAGMLHPAEDYIETTGSELPSSLSELVVRRLPHLSPAALQLLKIVAILGDAVSLRDVAAVARRPPAEVVEVLGEAFEAQLLDEAGTKVEFRHQLVHDAIYQSMPPSVRRVLHREAAAALTAAGADRLEVADHLMLGAERGDEEAVAWLRDASRQASATAPLVAVDLIARAETLLPAGHREADFMTAEAIQAQLRAGKVAEASARAEAVLARPHATEVDTPVRVALAAALALQNRADEVIRLAEASLRTPSGLPPPGQVLMLAQQSWAFTYSDQPAAGEDAARRALAIAEQTQDGAMMVWALTALLVAVGRGGRFEEALAYARRAAVLAAATDDVRSLPLKPKFFLGLALFDCDLVAEARAAYREALDDEFGSGWWSSEALVADAQASFVIGEWEDAVPGLLAAEQAAREKSNPLLVSQSLAYRVIIATAEGDHRVASELAAGLTSSLEGDRLSYNAGILAFAMAELKEAEGDGQGAYDMLLRCWRLEEQRGSRFYHRSLAPGLVRLALSFGERSVAAAVAETVAAGVAMAPDVPTVRSLALRCEGLVAGDCDLLSEAVALSRRAPLLVEHAGACEDAARLLAQSGRRDEAATFLAEALERYERAGAHAWVRRVRASQRELGFPPGPRGSRRRPSSGWESLTATEREVSRMVAEGLTNGAVARRLYISPHTVNTHLRHVFAKLNVPNRVALAAFVHHSIK